MQLNAMHSRLNCYLIPGLGATVEIFNKLELPAFVQRKPIKWIPPEPNEPLSDYAERLLPQIDQTKPFILIGCSFGGVIALELARHCKPELTVLISSVPASTYIPGPYKSAKWIGAYRLAALGCNIPQTMMRGPLALAFGVNDTEAINMLCRQVADSDPQFIKWAIAALLNWNHAEQQSDGILHFHGDADRILPLGSMQPDITIPGGGHLIVYTHGTEIGAAVSASLRDIVSYGTTEFDGF